MVFASLALAALPNGPVALVLLDPVSGTPLRRYRCSAPSPIRHSTVAVSRTHLVAAAADKPLLYVWTWAREPLAVTCGLTARATCVALSATGDLIAVGSGNGVVSVWQTRSGHRLASWPAHYRGVSCLAWNDDASFLVSAGEDAGAHAWSTGSIAALAARDSDAATASAGGNDSTPTCLRTWAGHSQEITGVVVGAGSLGASVVTVSRDATVRVWDLVREEPLAVLGVPAPATCVDIDVLETSVYVGRADGGISVLPFPGGSMPSTSTSASSDASPRQLVGHTDAVISVGVDASRSVLLSTSADASMRTWDLSSGQSLRRTEAAGAGQVVMEVPTRLEVTSDAASCAPGFAKLAKFPHTIGTDDVYPLCVQQQQAELGIASTSAARPAAAALQGQVVGLEAALADAGSELARWKQLGTSLYSSVVDSLLET